MTTLAEWAKRWSIPQAALDDLAAQVMPTDPIRPRLVTSEAVAQQRERLKASAAGDRLWRNNNGACTSDEGRVIRYGLGNDSAQLNHKVKSSDLIGITRRVITPGMVGSMVGVFTSVEMKRGGWTYANTPRERAQLAWLRIVVALGGIGRFSTGGN